jgi:hypothetical protein
MQLWSRSLMLEPNGNVRAAPSRWWRAADVLLVLGGGRAGRCVVQTLPSKQIEDFRKVFNLHESHGQYATVLMESLSTFATF